MKRNHTGWSRDELETLQELIRENRGTVRDLAMNSVTLFQRTMRGIETQVYKSIREERERHKREAAKLNAAATEAAAAAKVATEVATKAATEAVATAIVPVVVAPAATVALVAAPVADQTELHGLEKCIKLFAERLWKPLQNEVEGITKYYRTVESLGIDAESWMLDLIVDFSNKSFEKKSFGYFVGMAKTWLRLGRYAIPSKDMNDVVEGFAERIGAEPSTEACKALAKIMAEHGVVKLAFAISRLEAKSFDISLLYANELAAMMGKPQPPRPPQH